MKVAAVGSVGARGHFGVKLQAVVAVVVTAMQKAPWAGWAPVEAEPETAKEEATMVAVVAEPEMRWKAVIARAVLVKA